MTVHLRVRESLPASCEEAFDLIHDYPRRLEWDTLLRAAWTEDGAVPAAGVVATCTARRSLGGLSFRTRYKVFRRPEVAAVRLESPVLVFQAWGASIRHSRRADGGSDVEYAMTFTCRPRLLAPLLEPVVGAAFCWETRRRLAALRRALASGLRGSAPHPGAPADG
ncbi:MAG: SRPBCC family protein [Mycobacteriales bacterium]